MAVSFSRAVFQGKKDPSASPPDWVHRLFDGASDRQWDTEMDGMATRFTDGGPFALASVRVPGAARLDEAGFLERTTAAYGALERLVAESSARHPIRIWNLIPGILEPLGTQAHRYMSFNAGRYRAYLEWYRSEDRFNREVATASGVGHGGDDLVLHCLAATSPGVPVENPRQVPAYRYSERFGSLPPCFARATRIADGDGSRWLLVGGTASVCGEETMHVGDLESQAQETFKNLLALVGAGAGRSAGHETGPAEAACFRYLRTYFVREDDLDAVRQLVGSFFHQTEVVDYCHAELCRPHLLIEIEGVAQLPG